MFPPQKLCQLERVAFGLGTGLAFGAKQHRRWWAKVCFARRGGAGIGCLNHLQIEVSDGEMCKRFRKYEPGEAGLGR